MNKPHFTVTTISVLTLIPIVLSIGMAPALTDLFLPDADALQKSLGRASQSFGSRNNAIVCGDQLCADTQGPNISSFNPIKREAIASLRDQEAKNSDEATTVCREGQVLTFHFARNNHICTSEFGADLWERTGQAEKVVQVAQDEMMEETHDDSMEETHDDSMEETHDDSMEETHDDSMKEDEHDSETDEHEDKE